MKFLIILFLAFCLKQNVFVICDTIGDSIKEVPITLGMDVELTPDDEEYMYTLTSLYEYAIMEISYFKNINDPCDDQRNSYIENMKLLEKGIGVTVYHRVKIEERNFDKLAEDIKNSYYLVEINPELKSDAADCLNQCAERLLNGKSIDATLRKFCENRFKSFYNGFNAEVYQQVMPNHWKELKNQIEKREKTYKLALTIEEKINENKKITLEKFSKC